MSEKIARISRSLSWRHEFIRAHDYRCHYCNRFAGSVDVDPDGKPWHVEHKHALAAGGEDVEENLTLACERCNSLKHTLPYENFRRYAREIFWVGEPDRVIPKDLELLEASFLRTTAGKWLYRGKGDDGRTLEVLALDDELGRLDDASLIGAFDIRGSARDDGLHNVRFVIEAHRLAPKLIAEIHLLHAELALLRGTPPAIEDAP